MSEFAEIAITIVLAVLAIVLHELAHGFAALALGDRTALRLGRLSLNPLRHVDRFGTLLLPGFLLVSQLLTVGHVIFMFGWAKPVPIDARNFSDPRRFMGLVAAAGPAMNFSLAFLAAVLLRFASSQQWTEVLDIFVTLNLVLGLFNLFPVPPLDGGRIAVALLPSRAALAWARLERFGLLIVVALLVLPPVLERQGIRFDPIRDTLGPAVDWAHDLVLRLAGNEVAYHV